MDSEDKFYILNSFRKINTRFMEGNIDDRGVVLDILAEKYGMSVACNSTIDWSSAIYSNGFVKALVDGKTPCIDDFSLNWKKKRRDKEFHHILFNDECYAVFFDSQNTIK